MDINQEFEYQVTNLLQKGYPNAAGVSEKEFLGSIEPLRVHLQNLDVQAIDIDRGYLPFILVVKGNVVSPEVAMSLVERGGKQGITKLYPHESKDFLPIEDVSIPESPIYMLLNIDRGKETINIPPKDAFDILAAQNRSPLTIDEGIAIVTHHPEFLMKNNCFSLLASRHAGDQRVPAIWINGEKHPNLGWCWNGNPHTWLGSASCAQRL